MKPINQNTCIVALLFLLIWSIALNLLQGDQISRLMEEKKEMEYVQDAMSAHIQELEKTEGMEDEAE